MLFVGIRAKSRGERLDLKNLWGGASVVGVGDLFLLVLKETIFIVVTYREWCRKYSYSSQGATAVFVVVRTILLVKLYGDI